MLLLKVFRKQHCIGDDLAHVSIHSVATLMQDTLWCCQERIVPKKVWRVINYESKGHLLLGFQNSKTKNDYNSLYVK